MTTSRTTTTPAKSLQRPSRPSSIISKLGSPFASKHHTQIKHEIELEEPFRYFAPGDSVKGAVLLNVAKPVRATHLVVRLHGFVKVINHSKLPGEPIPYDENLMNSMGGRRGGEYFGNGFARLFEDEIVLCGDGRLLGQYVFRFELDLPRMGIPSSIDFENGTITYLVTSTLTRPTTISPTLVKHLKLKVKEKIDIAPIPIPRPQSVSLEAVRSRRPVIHMKRKPSAQQAEREAALTSTDELRDGSPSSPASAIDIPGSPVSSELSSTSVPSSNTSNTYTAAGGVSATDGKSTASASISFAASDKTITAQTEILQGGCLPGDVLPIKVSIDHIKPIKSMQGLIITLYRSARVDTHPALPLGPSNRQGTAKYEDYYPKSRTGLGGLSLSSAGSSRTFRQDLAQTITPLMVDPQSLTAIIKTSIQVPEHIFPTIHGVPGSMIIFKYFIEVVIDLRGKLGQDRLLPKLNMIDTPQHAYGDPRINMEHGHDGTTFSATPGFSYLITDQIRRQKGVVHTRTEVVIGTRDSARSRGKQKEENGGVEAITQPTYPPGSEDDRCSQATSGGHAPDYSRHQQQYDVTQSQTFQQVFTSPLPDTADSLDEKAQLRRLEQTLLPSAPPQDADSPLAAAPTPSAPFAFDEEDFIHRYGLPAPAPAYESPQVSSGSETIQSGTCTQSLPGPGLNRTEHGIRVPAMPPSPIDTGDDKQELERQRLMTLASSPDHVNPDAEPSISTTHQAPHIIPSAPILFEDEVNDTLVEQTLSLGMDARRPDPDLSLRADVSSTGPLPDEQEMERVRLQQLASSPDDHPGDIAEASTNSAPRPPARSQSVIDEHSLRNARDDDANGMNNEQLPVYER
ncbi:MAG: hypothetical protein Q9217_003696 [Psora testacea]